MDWLGHSPLISEFTINKSLFFVVTTLIADSSENTLMNIFVEDIKQDVIIGIDLYSFEVKAAQPFFGVKNVPLLPTLHVIHFQQTENGLRYGYWFETDQNAYMQFQYDATKELFVPKYQIDDQSRNDAYNRFQKTQHLMIAYPSVDEEDRWHELTKHVRWSAVKHSTASGGYFAYVDSVMTTTEENNLLSKVLANRCESSKREIVVPDTEAVLNYTPIVFKSTEAIRPQYKMEDFLDKSWYLGHVILPRYHHNSFYALLGEFQWAFLNAMLFANYGSSLQWHSILELVCFSSTIAPEHVRAFDEVVAHQLTVIPAPYCETLLNEQVWSKCMLRSFQAIALPHTTRELEKTIPDVLADIPDSEERDYAPGTRFSGAHPGVNLNEHTIGSDSDDDGPVVVERICYTPL